MSSQSRSDGACRVVAFDGTQVGAGEVGCQPLHVIDAGTERVVRAEHDQLRIGAPP